MTSLAIEKNSLMDSSPSGAPATQIRLQQADHNCIYQYIYQIHMAN